MSKTNEKKIMYDKLTLRDRGYKVLYFPEDIDSNGSKNIMLININAVDGSRYAGDVYNIIGGETPAYQEKPDSEGNGGSSSLVRKMEGVSRRIDTVIALYVPNNIQTSYGADWNTTNLGAIGTVIDASTGLGDLSSRQGWSDAWEAVKKGAPQAIMNTIAGATQTLTGLNVADAKDVATRSVTNPYTEVIFNGVQNRTFSFTFKFIPKSASEQAQVVKIIDTIKFHRAPEIRFGNINNYMLFPSEFDIKFIHNGYENDNVFKISTCALTNMSLNHGGDSHFATHDGGAPFFTEMTLEFTELELLTKKRHKEGY